MDRTAQFQALIMNVMNTYVQDHVGQEPTVSYKIIADDARKQYQVVLMGWHQRKRVYHIMFHLEIIENKIWIQEDNTEDSVAEMLVEQGASKQDIVLAYFSEFHRRNTEYAVS